MTTVGTTLLEATNICLRGIGQYPITTGPPSTNPTEDENAAVAFINEALRFLHVQRELLYAIVGYTDVEKSISVDGSQHIVLPANTARVTLHPEDPDYTKKYVVERQQSGVLLLYNQTDETFLWSGTKKLKLSYFLDFIDLPEAARYWVAMKAKVSMILRKQGDPSLAQTSIMEERAAWTAMIQDAQFRQVVTVFDSYSAARPIMRQYPPPLHPLP